MLLEESATTQPGGTLGSQQPDPLQKPSLDERRKMAMEVNEYWQYYTNLLMPYFRTAVRQRRLYMNQLKDRRLPTEKWRAFVPQAYAWSATKSLAASFNEVIFSIDPPVQPVGLGRHGQDLENQMIRLFDYIFRKTNFRARVKRSFEDALIEGTKIRKNTLVNEAHDVIYFPSQDAIDSFQHSLADAVSQGVQMPDLNDPVAFGAWREQAMQAGVMVPEVPTPGPKRVVRYRGPGFLDMSLFDMRFDPHLSPEDQVCVIQHAVKPWSWVEARTGPDMLFDPEAVDAAQSSMPNESEFDEWQQQLSDMLGVQNPNTTNPRLKKPVEIWETWMPSDPRSYRVVLNRQIVVNNSLLNPYAHGNHPYIFIRNHPTEGRSVGIPEFKTVERMLYELNTLRGLRLDAVLLSVLPVFIKAKDAGLADRMREFVPGAILETARPEAFKTLDKVNIDPAIFREIQEIRQDIDETVGSLPVIRGQQAEPRVAALSTEKAFNSTLARVKDRVIEFEAELNPFVDNSLFILYQFMPPEWRVRVGAAGDQDQQADPFVKYKTEDFLEAMEMDFAFRGATTALNRDMELQQLREWFTVCVNSQMPEFKAADMAKYITDRLTKNRADQFFRTEQEMQQQAQAAQEAQAQQAGGPQPGGTSEPQGPPQGAPA